MDWFEQLTGFREDPVRVRTDLEVSDGRLTSRANGRSYGVGRLEIVSLGELRNRVAELPPREGRLSVSAVTGDVREMHRDPAHRNALFQVASQFNVLEMASDRVTPDDGVTGYETDHTQGPACAIAAGAATIYRNYFVDVGGQVGQTAARQIDCLKDIGAALGNKGARLWEMRNGYVMSTTEGLRSIQATLAQLDESGLDELRSKLRIGIHWNVEVTDRMPANSQLVSQAFCSALPVRYNRIPAREWAAFATLVLEAAYEATLLAARLNDHGNDSNVVFLTRLGGGVFRNEPEWIQHAMTRALALCREVPLDVRLVARGSPDADHHALVRAFK